MSLALIQEAAKEVRRLSIAGSPLAVGDFRLKKLTSPLEQAGAKVPVFAQVAKAISDLVDGKEANSAANLLTLSTLLNAILYTQGQSSTDAPHRELETYASNFTSTKTTARGLKPLIQALTTTGGGRYEIVKSAFERGSFKDMRLIDPSIQALGDTFPELADLMAEKILPTFGPGIVPRLKTKLDLKGKRQDARTLTVMHRLDAAGTLPLCKAALEDGATDVKVAAIACLGDHEDCLPLVMEQANAKNKQLRAAALEALAAHDRPEITKLFSDLIKGKTLDILAGPFRALRNRQVLSSLLDEARRVLMLVVKGDSEQIPRFWEILDCLNGREEDEVAAFLVEGLASAEKLSKVKAAKNSIYSGEDLVVQMAELLYGIGTPKALETLLERREALPAAAFSRVLRAALRTWPTDKVFKEFSPLLEQKKGAGKDKSVDLLHLISSRNGAVLDRVVYDDEEEGERDVFKDVPWDARWLDAAIKADQPTAVCSLARPNHKGALDYLLQLDFGKKAADAGEVIRALVLCGYPKVTDYFLALVTKKTKSAKYFDYELQYLFRNAQHLPAADLPRLDEFAAKLNEKFVDPFLEAIAPLRPVKPE